MTSTVGTYSYSQLQSASKIPINPTLTATAITQPCTIPWKVRSQMVEVDPAKTISIPLLSQTLWGK